MEIMVKNSMKMKLLFILFASCLLSTVSSERGWMMLGGSTNLPTSDVMRISDMPTRVTYLQPLGSKSAAGKNYRAISSEMATLRAMEANRLVSRELAAPTPEESKRLRRKSRRKTQAWCLSLPGLVSKQRKMCLENPDLVAAAMQGTELAVKECERQFKYDRWNCTLILTNMSERRHGGHSAEPSDRLDESSGEVLTPGLKNATREGAFIHAIMSAGIAHAVTVACRRGELAGCHCDKSVSKLNVAMEILREMIAWDETNSNGQNHKVAKAALEAIRKRRLYGAAASQFLRNRTTTRNFARLNPNSPIAWQHEVEKISWGGCSDDVKYGVRFSRRFLEAPYKGTSYKQRGPKDDVKLHNGEVGRRMVQDLTKVHCRCHGMSGACTAQTCWMQMANFQEIGDSLKRKFESGVKALGEPKRRRRLRHVTDSGRLRKVPKTQLAFINDSPNLCLENETLGILGTAGRQCLKHSGDKGDCRVLCCGRGYNTKQVEIKRRCKCKFIYCCDVQCEICDEIKNEYTCKD